MATHPAALRPVEIRIILLTESRPVLLTAQEAGRAGRFHFERDRIRWTRARSALRGILAEAADASPLELEFALGPHGKPSLPAHPGLEFNLSHSGDYALVAIARDCPVGVDIQQIREKIDMSAMLRRLGENDLPSDPAELFHRWTRREARSKAAGGALFDPPAPDIFAANLIAPDGYSAAVALRGFEPQPVYCGSL